MTDIALSSLTPAAVLPASAALLVRQPTAVGASTVTYGLAQPSAILVGYATTSAVTAAITAAIAGLPAPAALPAATTTVLGGVKAGTGLAVAGDGTLSTTGGGATPLATITPLVNGTGAVGTSTSAARADHVHPSDTTRLAAANNLSDLAAPATARTNLGLAPVAASGAYSDLTGKPALGGAATLGVGTAAGTVAAGDDSRITGALQTTNAAITGALATWFASLPTTLPGTAGQPWNNGKTLAFS